MKHKIQEEPLTSTYTYSHVVGRIDWDATPYAGRVYQMKHAKSGPIETHTRLTIKTPRENYKASYIFEVCSGYPGCRLETITTQTQNSTSTQSIRPNPMDRIWRFNEADQTQMANCIFQANERCQELFLRSTQRYQRCVGHGSTYFAEDALLVLCTFIDGFGNYLLHRKDSGKFGFNQLRELRKVGVVSEAAARAYEESRNILAHGAINRLTDGGAIRDNARILANHFPEIAFKAIEFKPTGPRFLDTRYGRMPIA